MLKGFRAFLVRGNVIDLAVAVVFAGAFGAVVASFVADILTPLLGLIGVPDFSRAAVTVGDAEVRYGLFLNALIAFVLVAAAIYVAVIQPLSRGAPVTKTCTECASEIPIPARRCPMCTQPQPDTSAP